MKKILIILAAIISMGYIAKAQKATKKVAEATGKTAQTQVKKKHKVHREPKVQQDFHVCKDGSGYYICEQAPAQHNSTHRGIAIKENHSKHANYQYGVPVDRSPLQPKEDATGPKSQSYPENINTTPGVCDYPYSKQHGIVLGPQ